MKLDYSIHLDLCQSGALDLDWHVERKRLDGNATSGRSVAEVVLVGLVHLCEVTHIGEEDVHLLDIAASAG